MKNIFFAQSLMPLTLVFATTFALQAKPAIEKDNTNKTTVLNIYHTNDTHSCIEPISEKEKMLAGTAGYVRRATYIEQERIKDPELLLFDSGDFCQGTPYFNLFKGDVEISMMNVCKYDAAALGNHEFDFGMENIKRIAEMAKFPLLCANYDFSATCLKDVIKKYVVIERKGIKIGVFGLSPQPAGLIQAKKTEGILFLDPIKTSKEMVHLLRDELKCDVVIVLSHLGYSNMKSDQCNDRKLVPATSGINFVLGGHSHTYLEKPVYMENAEGISTPITQMGKNASFVGHEIMKLEKE